MIRYGAAVDVSSVVAKAQVLAEALPWLKRFGGRFVVVKVGGEILADIERLNDFAHDVSLLHAVGIRVVVCHGGGPQISELSDRLGLAPRFIDGQRVTDDETLSITSMVLLGEVNRKLVGAINSKKPVAVGLSGLDAGILTAVVRDPQLGHVGEVTLARCDPIIHLIDGGFIPVICSLGFDGKGGTLNINADLAAAAIASALGAEKLVLVTNVSGLYESLERPESLISEIDSRSLRRLRDSGALSGGIVPKVEAMLAAIDGGVARVHVIDGRMRHAILVEFFTKDGVGTMVYP